MSEVSTATDKKLASFTKRIRTEYINSRDMASFIDAIEGKIDIVVDIRWATYHKTKQGFRPEEFKEKLESVGINYIYIRALGNPFHALYSKEEFEVAKKDYLNYLKYNSKANKFFKELFGKFRFKKIYCLVCYCNTEEPLMCHRFWLREALINTKRARLGLPEDYVLVKDNQKTLLEFTEMRV